MLIKIQATNAAPFILLLAVSGRVVSAIQNRLLVVSLQV
jgi:hypothetical protein